MNDKVQGWKCVRESQKRVISPATAQKNQTFSINLYEKMFLTIGAINAAVIRKEMHFVISCFIANYYFVIIN